MATADEMKHSLSEYNILSFYARFLILTTVIRTVVKNPVIQSFHEGQTKRAPKRSPLRFVDNVDVCQLTFESDREIHWRFVKRKQHRASVAPKTKIMVQSRARVRVTK